MTHIILEWPINICLFLYYHFTLIQQKTINVSFVTDNSSMTTESIPTSLLVEPCTLCDDDGTFDYKETVNESFLDYYNCTEVVEQLNDRNSYSNWKHWDIPMLSIDECTDLKEQCIDCHLLV